MDLAKNIVKYRQKNNLSQEQLAQALSISRQSISKWETGENLPSIDNLISLSGLLDISLDELITGEPYLHFPFDYGKPEHKWPAVLLFGVMIFFGIVFPSTLTNGIINRIFLGLVGALIIYIATVWIGVFDFKRYYSYWTLDKKGIRYPRNNQEVYNAGEDLILPIMGIFKLRKTDFIVYKKIKSIEIRLDLFEFDPKKMLVLRGSGGVLSNNYNESFYLKIKTDDDHEIYLNLKQYYYTNSKEREMLPTIVAFLKRKNVEFVDKQGIAKILLDCDLSLTATLYKLRDQS